MNLSPKWELRLIVACAVIAMIEVWLVCVEVGVRTLP